MGEYCKGDLIIGVSKSRRFIKLSFRALNILLSHSSHEIGSRLSFFSKTYIGFVIRERFTMNLRKSFSKPINRGIGKRPVVPWSHIMGDAEDLGKAG